MSEIAPKTNIGHGILAAYSRGCRCDRCRAAMAAYQKQRRRRIAERPRQRRRERGLIRIYCDTTKCRGHLLTLEQLEQERQAGRAYAYQRTR